MCLGKIDRYCLIYKYLSFAGFDWCQIMIDRHGALRFYDYEEKHPISFSKVLRLMFDNGMLDECYSKYELELLFNFVPDEFKMEINFYLEDYDEPNR